MMPRKPRTMREPDAVTAGGAIFRARDVAGAEPHYVRRPAFGASATRVFITLAVTGATVASVQFTAATQNRGAVVHMPEKLGTNTVRPVAAHRDETDTRTPSFEESLGRPVSPAEIADDIVPYIPPLASYRVELEVGPARLGVPIIHPEDLYGDDE